MSELETRFREAARGVMELSERPDNQTLLKLYGLYKQSTVGDVSGERPGISDLAGRFKYDAWAKLKGMLRNEAMQSYVSLVGELQE